MLTKSSLLDQEKNYIVENGGDYVTRSLTSILTTLFNT
jgi:hypothetical protein